jgi:hypothetical protein
MASTVSKWIFRPVGDYAKERTLVGPVIGLVGRDDLTLGRLPIKFSVEVGESSPQRVRPSKLHGGPRLILT